MKYTLTILFILSIQALFGQVKPNLSDTLDIHTIDGIVNECLTLISLDKGQKINEEKFKSLFLPTAHFTVISHSTDNSSTLTTMSLTEFLEISGNSYKNHGFIEYELGKVVDEYNNIAHVFQSYYAKEGDFEEKGMNSYQLVYHDNRWWISNIIWTNNRNGKPIPEKYLMKK